MLWINKLLHFKSFRWGETHLLACASLASLSTFFAAPNDLGAADAVEVTVRLDENILVVGQTTTLRVMGEIDAAIEADAERVFSWFIDVLNQTPGVISPDWATVKTTLSDNVPQTSGSGTTDATGNRRGVHNTFLDQPGAGKGEPVELLSVKVTAHALGESRFSVDAGSGVNGLTYDFIVAPDPAGGSVPPFTGGDYSAASALVRVVPEGTNILNARTVQNGALTEIHFEPVADRVHRVEVSDDLTPGSWTPLPGAPHNTGVASDPSSGSAKRRFYRVVVSDP